MITRCIIFIFMETKPTTYLNYRYKYLVRVATSRERSICDFLSLYQKLGVIVP